TNPFASTSLTGFNSGAFSPNGGVHTLANSDFHLTLPTSSSSASYSPQPAAIAPADDSWGFSFLGKRYLLNPFNANASWNPFNNAALMPIRQASGEALAVGTTGHTVPIGSAEKVQNAFLGGEVRGAKNIVVGTGKAAREMGYMAADFTNASLEATTGHTI